MTPDDAPFILELLNDPAFVHFVGDRGLRTVEDASAYLLAGPIASYDRHGYGMYLTARKADGAPIGICGLVRRETFDAPDVGFAFLPAFRGRGYAYESAAAVMAHARHELGLRRVLAIVDPANARSVRLLEKLGLMCEANVQLGDAERTNALYALNA